jgi:outer membrane lipoprotein-sorting protein
MLDIHPRKRPFLVVLLSTLVLNGCLFHTRTVDRQLSNQPLKTASQQELIEYVDSQATKIQSMLATVDIDASAGNPQTSKITDYKEIRGYVLARKPSMLRMKGLMPVVRNTAFDMVSDGQQFKVWIPTQNKFYVGTNSLDNFQPDKRLENLRPQYIYDALLMPRVGQDVAVMDNGYETVLDAKRHRVEQPNYSLLVIKKDEQGSYLSRKIDFSRVDLLPYRQRIYDQEGNVATDVHYQNYKDWDGTKFASTIEIERPREGYDITLNMVKLEINKQLTDDQFALDQPSGADVVHLGQPKADSQNMTSRQRR